MKVSVAAEHDVTSISCCMQQGDGLDGAIWNQTVCGIALQFPIRFDMARREGKFGSKSRRLMVENGIYRLTHKVKSGNMGNVGK